MIFTLDNKQYTFNPQSVVSFNDIIIHQKIIDNDVFEKYQASTTVDGELIICNDISKLKKTNKKIIRETYEQYLEFIETRDINKDKWIYNIIDGLAEQSSILYKDDKCIIMPTYTWNSIDINKLHILCIPFDKSLRCIRSLDKNSIPLLNYMKQVSLEIINTKYDLDDTNLKIFLHYNPSPYHLHIHFIHTIYQAHSSVEYSHELNNVIFNLELDSDYYKKIVLNKQIVI